MIAPLAAPRSFRRRPFALAWLLAGLLGSSAGCDEDCCNLDEQPIPLVKGPAGELLVRIATGDATTGLAVLDTGSPVTLWATPVARQPPALERRAFTLLGPPTPTQPAPVRAIFHRVIALGIPLGAVGADAGPPAAVIGGDVLRSFSVELGFAAPELRLWLRHPAGDGFLAAAGYAVLHMDRHGGGEVEAWDPQRRFGKNAPFAYPSSRLVARACVAPDAFDRQAPLPAVCAPGDARAIASGADLSLLLATGTGPLVLGRSAWARVSARASSPLPEPSPRPDRPLWIATFERPIPAAWSRLPRLALVNREADLASDPGPCAELARARRLEQVAWQQSQNTERAACALPCDQDPRRSGCAVNSAAYLELGGIEAELEVAVIDDAHPLLQGVRAEVRPEGPEVDGLIGAGTLAGARVELDSLGTDTRAIFSCDQGPPTAIATATAPGRTCRAVARCPRLPGPGQKRPCFGLPAHGLPKMCENLPVTCGS